VYDSMFSVDGLPNIPDKPIPGPNLNLATDMGIVMGTSHHEPIGRNKVEWDKVKTGPWDWTNKEVLIKVRPPEQACRRRRLTGSTGRMAPSGRRARMSCILWACVGTEMSRCRARQLPLWRVSEPAPGGESCVWN